VSTDAPLLEFRDVSRRWRAGILGSASEVTALEASSFTVERGEVFAVTGAPGSGKSTLLMLAAAQVPPTTGSIRWCGVHDASTVRPQLIGARPWEYTFLTVRQALAFHADQLALSDAGLERRTRFLPLMAQVGLRGLSRARLGQLGALDQLRVVLAQALIAEPTLICCDEPMGLLGPRERLEAAQLLRNVAGRGIALLLATREEHTLTALGVADRSLRLECGRTAPAMPGATRSVLELSVPQVDDAFVRLASRLPSLTRRGRRIRVPLAATTPEAVLAACRDAGVAVRASRVAEEPLPLPERLP
jgi:branched-chain amino acid transport system ATP-binding protein